MKHWKVYEPIECPLVFDGDGAGPRRERVQVLANVHPSEMYPAARIVLSIGSLATGCLTAEQSAELRALLERAEHDVMVGRLCAGKEPADG